MKKNYINIINIVYIGVSENKWPIQWRVALVMIPLMTFGNDALLLPFDPRHWGYLTDWPAVTWRDDIIIIILVYLVLVILLTSIIDDHCCIIVSIDYWPCYSHCYYMSHWLTNGIIISKADHYYYYYSNVTIIISIDIVSNYWLVLLIVMTIIINIISIDSNYCDYY